MFLGREEELELLQIYLGKPHKHALLLYGKRRVGKSTLILKAVEDIPCKVIYFECLQSSLASNLELFTEQIKNVCGNQYVHFQTFVEAFAYLGTLQEKLIVVIDEYSYLKEVGNGKYVDSLFQSIIDQMQDNIDVVLLGSYVSVMKELMEQENPLFGRFALVMKVKAFDYYDSALFYKTAAVKQKIDFYAIFGGLPFTNALLDATKSLEENIIFLLLNTNSAVRIYLENILLKELAKVAPSNMILAALANGKKKYSELERLTGVHSNGALDKQLKNLLDMEVIQKVYPINKPHDRKKTFYEIQDNLVRFYYAYIYGHTDVLTRIGAKAYYNLYIEPSMKTFLAHRFEALVREYFQRQVKSGKLQGVYDVGTFWYDVPEQKSNGEFDCVLQYGQSYVFYEVKYYEKPLPLTTMQQEAEQVQKLAAFAPVKEIGFVALQGFAESVTAYRQISAADLY